MLSETGQALRALRRGAGPWVPSVLALALGIAATATFWSVVDAIDFRPLPFRDPQQLVVITEADREQPDLPSRVSPGVYRDWRERAQSLSSLAAASSVVVSLEDQPGEIRASRVSDNFFSTLDFRPLLGRALSVEDINGQERVVVISYDLWQSRFAGEPRVIGRTTRLSWAGEFRSVGSEPYTLVGVLPRGMSYPLGSQVWIPAAGGFGDSRQDPFLTVIGRLRDGVSVTTARAEFQSLSAQLAADFPQDDAGRVARFSTLREAMRSAAKEYGAGARFALLAVALLVLLLAVLNVSTVFLARAAAQFSEFRLRLALGASAWRLGILLLIQSTALSLVAGGLSLVFSGWLMALVSARLRVAEAGRVLMLDGRFVFWALLLALLSGLLVALVPWLRLRRDERRGMFGALSVRGSGVARTGGAQRSLVVGQIALSMVLLTGAGLLSSELLRLVGREVGFDAKNLLVGSLPINLSETPEAAMAQAKQVEADVAGLGGISAVALGGLPAEGYTYHLDDRETLEEGRRPLSYRVSPGYFTALGILLEAGRPFEASDIEGTEPVAVVSRKAAESWWPNQQAVGKTLSMVGPNGRAEVVRVVGVVANESVSRSLTREHPPTLYRPFDQLSGERRRIQVFARPPGPPGQVFQAVARVLEESRGRSGWQGEGLTTMESVLGASLREQRFRAGALMLFSAVALLLAALGVFGVVATWVCQREGELGVRLALGARPAQLLTLVVQHGLGMTAVGLVLGFAGALALTRWLRTLLVEPRGLDLPTLLATSAVLVLAVLAACVVPARRAARLEPTRLLRQS